MRPSDPRWEPFCPACGAAMQVAGSPTDRWWACGRCAEDELLASLAARPDAEGTGTGGPGRPIDRRPLRRERLGMRRLPEASRTRARHAILLRTDRGEQRGYFDGPLPLWLHRGGVVYVIDFTPEHEGNEQVWVYRAVASTAPAGAARAAVRAGWRRP